MSGTQQPYGATFSIADWLRAGQACLEGGDYASATGHAMEAHNRMRETSTASRHFRDGSAPLGQLCRAILKTPRPVSDGAVMATLYTDINVLMIMREHLGDHLQRGGKEPLPAVWEDLALRVAEGLARKRPWEARRLAELAYANPGTSAGNRPALRQLALAVLQPSLKDKGLNLADMMWDPLNELRLSGVFARDPDFAAVYNNTICTALPLPRHAETQLGYKMLFLLGMPGTQPVAQAIKTEFDALLASASPRQAYDTMMTGRLLVDERMPRQPLPDQPTRRWVKASLRGTWNTLCRLTPQEARLGPWEQKWRLPAPPLS